MLYITIDSETATFSVYHGAGVGGGGTIIMVSMISICCCVLRRRRAYGACCESMGDPPYEKYVQLPVEEGEDTSGQEHEGTHNSLPDIHFNCMYYYR